MSLDLKDITDVAKKTSTASNPVVFVLVNYWQYILILLLLVVIGFQFVQNKTLTTKVQLEIAKSENTRVELAQCQAQVGKFNDAMDELLDNSVEFRDALLAMDKSINRMVKTTEEAIDDILSQPTPATCEKAIEFMRQADKTILMRNKK